MAKNLENINKQRQANGLPPLEKLPGEGGVPPSEQENDPPPDPPPGTPPTDPPAPGGKPPAAAPDAELDDEKLLAALNKKGIAVGSLADLLPKPDPAKEAEKREVAKLSYSLGKGLFSLKEHENYIRERNNPRDLVFAEFYQEAKKEDDTLSNEDIQAEFEEKYGINADPNSRKFKTGAREIGLLADTILKDRYKNIYAADSTFSVYETQEKETQTRNRAVLAKAPAYRKDVDDIFAGFKKIPISISDTESYEVEFTDEELAPLKALFLDPDTCAKQILGNYTPEGLKQVAYTTLLTQHFKNIFHRGAEQYHFKRQKGTKGIPPIGPQGKQNGRILTENQKQVLADNNIKEEDLPPVTAN